MDYGEKWFKTRNDSFDDGNTIIISQDTVQMYFWLKTWIAFGQRSSKSLLYDPNRKREFEKWRIGYARPCLT